LPNSSNPNLLFKKAKELGVDISVGFAERAADGRDYNTSIYYSVKEDKIISKYRKVRLPDTKELFPNPDAINQVGKRYFSPGDLGFQAFRAPNLIPSAAKKTSKEGSSVGIGDPILGMTICNDR
jgi:predicted amidohydrolase